MILMRLFRWVQSLYQLVRGHRREAHLEFVVGQTQLNPLQICGIFE
jgi:hypothetical protein